MARCLRCGKKVGVSTKYCKKCRGELKKSSPDKKQRVTADFIKKKNVQCRTCKYRWRIPNGEGKYLCDYLEITGHMRPCDPSPDCTAYERM